MKRFLLSIAVIAATLTVSGAAAQAGHGHKIVHSHGHSHVRIYRPVYTPVVSVPQIHYDVVPHYNLYSPGVHLDVVPHINTVPYYRLNSGHCGW